MRGKMGTTFYPVTVSAVWNGEVVSPVDYRMWTSVVSSLSGSGRIQNLILGYKFIAHDINKKNVVIQV